MKQFHKFLFFIVVISLTYSSYSSSISSTSISTSNDIEVGTDVGIDEKLIEDFSNFVLQHGLRLVKLKTSYFLQHDDIEEVQRRLKEEDYHFNKNIKKDEIFYEENVNKFNENRKLYNDHRNLNDEKLKNSHKNIKRGHNNGTSSSIIDKNMSCKIRFQEKCDMYYAVKYWNYRFFPQDCYRSILEDPEYVKPEDRHYVVFNLDPSGWNNMRLGLESVIMFAHATGRTLVLPPVKKLTFHHIGKESSFSMKNYFELERLNDTMNIITMEDFLKIANNSKKLMKFPYGGNITENSILKDPYFWPFMDLALNKIEYNAFNSFFVINAKKKDIDQSLRGADKTYQLEFPPLNESHKLSGLYKIGNIREMRHYNETLYNMNMLYFPGTYDTKYRMLVPYYTFYYHEDDHIASIYRRIGRDRMKLDDNFFCLAGKIIRKIHDDTATLLSTSSYSRHHDKAHKFLKHRLYLHSIGHKINTPYGNSNSTDPDISSVDPSKFPLQISQRTAGGKITTPANYTLGDANYFAMHIRRGDFKDFFKPSYLNGEELNKIVEEVFDPNISKVIYVATDEKDLTYFDKIRQAGKFELRFMKDYQDIIDNYQISGPGFSPNSNKDPNIIAMVEQIICANAHTFMGTPLSTFSAYIGRLRGWYPDDRYSRTYYTIKDFRNILQKAPHIMPPLWSREYSIFREDTDDYFQEEKRNIESVK